MRLKLRGAYAYEHCNPYSLFTGELMKTSSSFKFNSFFLTSLIVHDCKTGSGLHPFPAGSTLTNVDDTP